MLSMQVLALLCAALFAGAALYITIAEHPARLELADAPLLAQWQPSYRRALPVQAGLAVVGGLAGLAAGWLGGGVGWAVGGVVLLANWPFTMMVIMPVNKRLQALRPVEAGAESRAMLVRWGRLHAVRGGLGLAAAVMFAVLLVDGG